MTPQDMALLHAAAFAPERGWSASEFADLLAQQHTSADITAHGFALVRTIAGESELLTLAVDPDHQGRGIGRALVAKWLESVAADVAHLEVAEDNLAAITLYKGAGFVEIGRRKAYYARPGAAAVDAIAMKCDLTRGNAR